MTTPTAAPGGAEPARAPARAPDRPAIPRIGRSWLIKGYLGLSALVLIVFALAGVFGWELQGGTTERAPGSARQSPGGYRSYHFWHSGYNGGK